MLINNQPVVYGQPQPPAFAYGYPQNQQPQFYQAPPQQLIILQQGTTGACPFCSKNSGVIERTKVGGTALAWGAILFCATGFLCCIPCCIPECMDK